MYACGKGTLGGGGYEGHLGNGKGEDALFFEHIPLPEHVVGAACGIEHTLLFTDSGSLYAFGSNVYGQCGVERPFCLDRPTRINVDGRVVSAACGRSHSVIVVEI